MEQKHILLFSQARQGHHAVMEWLCQQSETGSYHNNLVVDGSEIKNRNWQYNYRPKGLVITRRQANPVDVLETPGTAELIIYNFINQVNKIELISRMFGSKEHIVGIVIRDLYNFMASLLNNKMKSVPQHINHWKLMVRTVLEDKRILDINFNSWFASCEYRVALTERLGLHINSPDLPEHSKIGQSSFEENAEAKDLRVLDRWKRFKHNKNYWKLFDKEAIELNKQYFGFSYKQE